MCGSRTRGNPYENCPNSLRLHCGPARLADEHSQNDDPLAAWARPVMPRATSYRTSISPTCEPWRTTSIPRGSRRVSTPLQGRWTVPGSPEGTSTRITPRPWACVIGGKHRRRSRPSGRTLAWRGGKSFAIFGVNGTLAFFSVGSPRSSTGRGCFGEDSSRKVI